MNKISVTSKFTLFRSLALIAFFDVILIRILLLGSHPAISALVMLYLLASCALAFVYVTKSVRTWSTLPHVSTEENIRKMIVFASLGFIALIAFPEHLVTYFVLASVTAYRGVAEILG